MRRQGWRAGSGHGSDPAGSVMYFVNAQALCLIARLGQLGAGAHAGVLRQREGLRPSRPSSSGGESLRPSGWPTFVGGGNPGCSSSCNS